MNKEKMSPALKSVLKTLLLLIQILIWRLWLNSKNSSTPPSQDQNRKRWSSREKSNRKPWWQPWRKWVTLRQVEDPDNIIELPVNKEDLPEDPKWYRLWKYIPRQVIDIEINIVVTEYQGQVLISNSTGKKFIAQFPEGVNSSVQYGNGVKSRSVFLSQYQMIPHERLQEDFSHELGLPISPWSISNWNQEAYRKLKFFETLVKQKLIESERLNADETSSNINGKKHWLHTNSNDQWTYITVHKKRWQEAMNDMGVLSNYHWFLCHDHWKPYYNYKDITHCLCNAHHLRELQWVCDTEENHQWAKNMKIFLTNLNKQVESFWGKLDQVIQKKKRQEYRKILQDGETECPPPPEKQIEKSGKNKWKKPPWKIPKSKARNLLERLRDFEDDTLRFMTNINIPFTNNLWERDIRMSKVQQKISGCFRSEDWAKAFCLIRSYLSSAKKQGFSASYALQSLFAGKNIFW